jgi:hypothetical protein
MKRLLLLAGLVATQFTLSADVFSFVDSSAGQFGVVNLNTGAFQLIGTNSVTAGLAFSGGVIYGEDFGLNLVTIDPSTGATSTVGHTGINFSVYTTLGNGKMYGLDYAGNLYSIDLTTGAATMIGPSGLPPLGGGFANSLAASSSALYYTVDQTSPALGPALYTIDPVTAQATLVGPTQADMAGSAFVNGTLYGFTYPYINGADTASIFSIDTSTGAATFEAFTSPSVRGSINGGIPTVPEPSALLLLVTVIGAAAVVRRRVHGASRG